MYHSVLLILEKIGRPRKNKDLSPESVQISTPLDYKIKLELPQTQTSGDLNREYAQPESQLQREYNQEMFQLPTQPENYNKEVLQPPPNLLPTVRFKPENLNIELTGSFKEDMPQMQPNADFIKELGYQMFRFQNYK